MDAFKYIEPGSRAATDFFGHRSLFLFKIGMTRGSGRFEQKPDEMGHAQGWDMT
jgi:hypothetical protein